MKTALLRLLVVLVVAAGLLTLVVTIRMFSVAPRTAPDRTPHPFTFDEEGAPERVAGALRFPTYAMSGEEPDPAPWLELHGYLAEAFPRVHAELEVETVSDLSLLYTWRGSAPDPAPILLIAHQDVVPVEEETLHEWTHPPFAGVVEGGYVWGRGALDMKGPLVAILEAVEGLLEEGLVPRRTILLAFGHDEEVGGERGARQIRRVLEERGIHPQWVLDEGAAVATGVIPGIPDPVGLVGTGEKGYLTLELVARAEGGHSSAPPRRTAVGALARLLVELEEEPFEARLQGPVREMMEELAPHMDPGTRMLASNLWLFERPVLWAFSARPETAALIRTTAAPTVVGGGFRENVLPTTARALVNLRLSPWDSIDGVVAAVRERAEGLQVEVFIRTEGFPASEPSPLSSVDGPGFRLIREAIHRTFPDVVAVAPFLVFAATDARHYEGVAGDVYRFSPYRADAGTLERIHGIDERIPVREYLGMVRFYAELLRGAGEDVGPPREEPR
jgi:carboxypeptidase PM20D1